MNEAARKAWLAEYRRAGAQELLVGDVRVVDIEETAEELGIWRKTASTWRRRWMDAEATAGVAA